MLTSAIARHTSRPRHASDERQTIRHAMKPNPIGSASSITQTGMSYTSVLANGRSDSTN